MNIRLSAILLFGLLLMACSGEKPAEKVTLDPSAHAAELAQKFIITDGHIDLPYRLGEYWEDISGRSDFGDFDYERSRAGGLDAPFMSIYIPASYQSGGAKEYADQKIDMVYGFAEKHPDKFEVAVSVADVKRIFKEGNKISLPMGMENGAPIEGDLENLTYFYERGIRYITLTHSKNNHICDSSYDTERKWNGLSPFGKEVVAEMNRLGIIIDVSHISDSTFYQVMALSKAPVFASHSSCRHFTPDWERNMGDEMIQLMAEKDGVICINFGSSFLKTDYQGGWKAFNEKVAAYKKETGLEDGSEELERFKHRLRKDNPVGTVQDVADHIDHVVKLVGIDHVGFGSDYDGVTNLPANLDDASTFPNLLAELLKRGYSEGDIEKICSGNVLRVWSAVENLAAKMQAGK